MFGLLNVLIIREVIPLPCQLPSHLPSSSPFKNHCYEFLIRMPGPSQLGIAVKLNLSMGRVGERSALVLSPACSRHFKLISYSIPVGHVKNGKASKDWKWEIEMRKVEKGLVKWGMNLMWKFVPFFFSCFPPVYLS